MTNNHKQQKENGHQQWPDYKNQPLSKTSIRTTNQEDEEEEQHQHFSTFHPILKRSKKNQFYQLLNRNQQIS